MYITLCKFVVAFFSVLSVLSASTVLSVYLFYHILLIFLISSSVCDNSNAKKTLSLWLFVL